MYNRYTQHNIICSMCTVNRINPSEFMKYAVDITLLVCNIRNILSSESKFRKGIQHVSIHLDNSLLFYDYIADLINILLTQYHYFMLYIYNYTCLRLEDLY